MPEKAERQGRLQLPTPEPTRYVNPVIATRTEFSEGKALHLESEIQLVELLPKLTASNGTMTIPCTALPTSCSIRGDRMRRVRGNGSQLAEYA